MSDIAGGVGERFDFGRVVGQTFSLIGRNFVLFLLLALLFVGIPQFALFYMQATLTATQDLNSLGIVSLVGALVTMMTAYILQGAMTRAAVDDLSKKGVSAGAAIADGFRYFFPLVGVAILVGVGMFLGFLLLIVPGILLAVRWVVTAPIVVVEQHGPTRSMGRSAELTEDHRWAIFGLLILYVILSYGVQMLAGFVFAATGALPETAFLTMDAPGLIFGGVSAVIAALLTLVSTVGTASLYFELRRVKEGVGVEEIASVFD